MNTLKFGYPSVLKQGAQGQILATSVAYVLLYPLGWSVFCQYSNFCEGLQKKGSMAHLFLDSVGESIFCQYSSYF